jgi:Iap family predicted aminopeptidase
MKFEMKIDERLRAHVEAIVGDYPSRHAGSEGDYAAADYIEGEFRALGLTVLRESYPVRGWRYRSAALEDVTLGCAVPGFTACYFSASCDVTGKLLILEDLPAEDVAVKGRICFCTLLEAGVGRLNKIAEELERRGAAAVIFTTFGHCDVAPSTKRVRSAFIESIATLAVNPEGGFHLLSHSDHTYHVAVDAEPYDTVACNVIGRREGGSKKAVFGAHYDASPLIAAAGDNASGTAMLIETARLFADYQGDCTLDFVAFSAEEYIAYDYPPGSEDYVKRHGQEDIAFFMNFDDYGIFFAKPYFELGNAEKLPADLLPPYSKATASGDDRTFIAAGIPTIWLCDKKPFRTLHTALDTIDVCNFPKMAEGVTTCYQLAARLLSD